MDLTYHSPAPELADLIGSYYELTTRADVVGTMRAEGPNFRCLLRGSARAVVDGRITTGTAPGLYILGPTTAAYHIEMTAGTVIFGAGLTPEGWRTAMGESAAALADRLLPYADFYPDEAALITGAMAEARSTRARVATANRVVAATVSTRALTPSAQGFVAATLAWLDQDAVDDIDALTEATGLSLRQVERLSKEWFGAGPKMLQRKYRALRTCDRLARDPAARWSDVADPSYTDQSHMIREFRRFIGCTPGQFASEEYAIVRETLSGRRGLGQADGIRFLA